MLSFINSSLSEKLNQALLVLTQPFTDLHNLIEFKLNNPELIQATNALQRSRDVLKKCEETQKESSKAKKCAVEAATAILDIEATKVADDWETDGLLHCLSTQVERLCPEPSDEDKLKMKAKLDELFAPMMNMLKVNPAD